MSPFALLFKSLFNPIVKMGLLGQDNYSISYHYLQTGVLLFMALYPLQFHHVLIAILMICSSENTFRG